MPKALLSLFVAIALPIFAEPVNPEEIAKAEVDSWKAYYEKDPVGILTNLSTMIRLQYQIKDPGLLRQVTYQLGTAIAKFGEMSHSADLAQYNKEVLPLLIEGYKSLKEATQSQWNAEKAAKYDMEWWMARRGGKKLNNPENVAQSMAKLYQVVYGDKDQFHFARAAYLRASAARYRDLAKWDWGNIQPKDWQIIQEILQQAYTELVLGIEANKQK